MTHKNIVFGVFVLVCGLFTPVTQVVAGVNYVLLDSDTPPKNVGFISSVSPVRPKAPLPIADPPENTSAELDQGRFVLTLLPIPDSSGVVKWILPVRVNPITMAVTLTPLYYLSFDCRGDGFIRQADVEQEFGTTFNTHVVMRTMEDPDVRALWVADPDVRARTERVLSFLDGDGCHRIDPVSVPPLSIRPALLLDPDLHRTYPPPYNLLFELTD